MKTTARVCLLGCLIPGLSMLANANSIWTEGDAGQGEAGGMLNSANVTVGWGALTDIIGTLGDPTTGSDMYEIYISNPNSFSATTTGNTKKPVVDPALYLFDSSGNGLFGNDNISGGNTQAQIPVGETNSLAAGLYFLLIAPSGNLPEDKHDNSIFGAISGTTGIFTGSGALKKYGGAPSGDDAGKGYDIVLTGAGFAETPEPATSAFTALGIASLAWRSRRGTRPRF